MQLKTCFSTFRYKFFWAISIALMMNSCATFNPGLIKYNEDKSLYEYGGLPENAVPLRNKNNELVSESNYESFLQEMEDNDNKYQSTKTYEKAKSIKFMDHNIASLYTEAVSEINKNQFEDVPVKMDSLLSIYPDALYFSDCTFLEGFALQKRGKTNDAIKRYSEFIDYSSGKYAERFRGYRDSDPKDSIWIAERNYAKSFVDGNQVPSDIDFFEPFLPKYYYNSFHPGFGINQEDYTEKTKDIIMLALGTDLSDNAAFGIQYYRQLNRYFDINPRYFTSKGINEIGVAVPIRLYKSENNSFALKLSPFINFSLIKELTVDDVVVEPDENMFDYGIKASAGYYFAPKLSLGASYIHHRYNKSDPFLLESQNIEIWYFNEYDISLYYDLWKGFSLKSGIKAGNFVAGIYWSGWEISYDFSQKDIVFRIDMF